MLFVHIVCTRSPAMVWVSEVRLLHACLTHTGTCVSVQVNGDLGAWSAKTNSKTKTCVRKIARSGQNEEEEEEKTPLFYVLRHLQCLYKIEKLYIHPICIYLGGVRGCRMWLRFFFPSHFVFHFARVALCILWCLLIISLFSALNKISTNYLSN